MTPRPAAAAVSMTPCEVLQVAAQARIAGAGVGRAEIGLHAVVAAGLREVHNSIGVAVRGKSGVGGPALHFDLLESRGRGTRTARADALRIGHRSHSRMQEQHIDALDTQSLQACVEDPVQRPIGRVEVWFEQADLGADRTRSRTPSSRITCPRFVSESPSP